MSNVIKNYSPKINKLPHKSKTVTFRDSISKVVLPKNLIRCSQKQKLLIEWILAWG